VIKVVAVLRRRPGLTHQEYIDYIVDVHGDLAAGNKMTVQRYVQNHVFDAAFGATGDGTHQNVLPRDSVTELWFEDMAGLGATFADPYTREVIGPDGPNFQDMPSALSLLVEEGEVHGEKQADGAPKVLWLLKARDGVKDQEFIQRWKQADERAAKASGVVRRVSEPAFVPEQSGGGGTDYFSGGDMIRYDGLQSLWVDARDPVKAMREYEELLLQDAADWLDPSRSFWLLAKEHEVY
jgi:hypothetical protein